MTRRIKENLCTRMVINITTIIACSLLLYFLMAFFSNVEMYWSNYNTIANINIEAEGWTNNQKDVVNQIMEQMSVTANEANVIEMCYVLQKTTLGFVIYHIVISGIIILVIYLVFVVCKCLNEWLLYFEVLIKTYVIRRKLAKELATFNESVEEEPTE